MTLKKSQNKTLEELQFNIIDYTDGTNYSATHTRLNNAPKYNKFKYDGANKDGVTIYTTEKSTK